MKIENTEVFNFEGAIRGMRNPLASWDKSDSKWVYVRGGVPIPPIYEIGENDMNLAKRLIKGGPEHRKFVRQIMVSTDITAPLYIWKELDTYKISTTANSTSTMHKLATTPITLDCFEIGDYDQELDLIDDVNIGLRINCFLDDLEQLRQKYNETKDKRYWKELVRWLPEGWLQTRTWTANYEVLYNIYNQRKGHKLIEWEYIRNWIESLPYFKELFLED